MEHKLDSRKRALGDRGPSERTCVGCQEVAARAELVRLVRDHRGVVMLAVPGAAGRGAYLHPARVVDTRPANPCLLRAQRSNAWARAFRAKITQVDEATLQYLGGSVSPVGDALSLARPVG